MIDRNKLPVCMKFRTEEELNSYLGTYEYFSLVEMAKQSNLPLRAWKDLTISAPKEDINAYKICHQFKENIKQHVVNGEGLFLFGGVGSGKTVWTYKIARHYMEATASTKVDDVGVPVYFANVPRLLDDLRVAMKDEQLLKMLDNRLMNADLVIFDDLGAENATEWAKDKLYQYIDYRYANCKASLFTSNKELDSIELRIADRIKGTCKEVEFTAESKRQMARGE